MLGAPHSQQALRMPLTLYCLCHFCRHCIVSASVVCLHNEQCKQAQHTNFTALKRVHSASYQRNTTLNSQPLLANVAQHAHRQGQHQGVSCYTYVIPMPMQPCATCYYGSCCCAPLASALDLRFPPENLPCRMSLDPLPAPSPRPVPAAVGVPLSVLALASLLG